MNQPNPYQAPQIEKEHPEELEKILNTDNLIWRAIATTAMSALFFGFAGGVIGWLIGAIYPDYYRTVFDAVDRIDFAPKLFGAVPGLTQGRFPGREQVRNNFRFDPGTGDGRRCYAALEVVR